MKITIQTADGRHFAIPLPLGMLGSSLGQNITFSIVRSKTGKDLTDRKELIRDLSRAVKDYVRENGKFVFLEMESAQGDYITIEV